MVQDVARAVDFYRDVLGLPLLFEAPPGLAFLDCGGVRLMFSRPEGTPPTGASSIIYYAVADIHAAHAALAAHGTRLEDEPHVVARMPDHDLWMCFAHDGEGNLLGLMSEVREGRG